MGEKRVHSAYVRELRPKTVYCTILVPRDHHAHHPQIKENPTASMLCPEDSLNLGKCLFDTMIDIELPEKLIRGAEKIRKNVIVCSGNSRGEPKNYIAWLEVFKLGDCWLITQDEYLKGC